jgi:ABC-type multidrug transport system fused ATPase/permease subunit
MFKTFAEMAAVARRLGLSRRIISVLFGLNILAVLFEGLGIAMLLPIFELLRAGGSVDSAELSGRYWTWIREAAGYVNLPVNLSVLLGASFLFICIKQMFSYINTRYYGMAQRQLANQIRQRMFSGFLKTDTALQDSARVGEIAGELTSELERALSSLFATIRALGTIVQLLIYFTGLIILSPPMSMLSLAVICVAAFFMRGLLSRVKETGAAITDSNVQLSAFVVEHLKNARLIRLSGTERAEAATFAELSKRHSEQSVQQKLVSSKLSLLPEPIAIGFSYLVLFFGSQVFGLGLDRLGLFVVVLIRIMPIVRTIIGDYNTIFGKWPSAQLIDRQLRRIVEAREPKGGATMFERLDRGIVYDHVSFSYVGSDAPALLNVSVALPAHKMSALVGPSGAGKSTFVDLLPRLRHPTEGGIRFDDTPIEEFKVASLRGGIAFVPQQPQIFNSTSAEHIRYGKEDATEAEIREAARLAGALDFIEALPQGFDTRLGEGGSRLSGGQRQRLDIARALVRRAPVLILDEPSSALDAETEAAFRDALRTLRSETDLTIIVIAHRLSTVADAEQIVVLRRGRLEAVGTHDALLAAGGWYAKSYTQQVEARRPDRASVS